jgi:hypothetical protein
MCAIRRKSIFSVYGMPNTEIVINVISPGTHSLQYELDV